MVASNDSWEIHFRSRHYVFPRADVIELPIENSTAELLAEYICNELCKALREYSTSNLSSIMVVLKKHPANGILSTRFTSNIAIERKDYRTA